jgi:hypothetical protein
VTKRLRKIQGRKDLFWLMVSVHDGREDMVEQLTLWRTESRTVIGRGQKKTATQGTHPQ